MEKEKKKRDYGALALILVTCLIGLYISLWHVIDYRSTVRNADAVLLFVALTVTVPVNLIYGIIAVIRQKGKRAFIPLGVSLLLIVLMFSSQSLGRWIADSKDEKAMARYGEVVEGLFPGGGSEGVVASGGDEVPMSAPVCTIRWMQGRGNLLYEATGDLRTWLGPVLKGKNTRSARWSRKAEDKWQLDVGLVAPEGGKGGVRFLFLAYKGGCISIEELEVGGEGVYDLDRVAFMKRVAEMAGLGIN